jgi:hypothetical protein
MSKVREHYIVFKGDDIIVGTADLKKAKEEFDKLPPKTRALDGRAIFKLVKED